MRLLLLKTKDGRLNMLTIFGAVIVLFGVVVFALWLPERNAHSRLQRHGKDVLADIEEVTYYDFAYKNIYRLTNDINDADTVKLRVRYAIGRQTYETTIGTTFSLQRNDHAALQDAIARRKVLIRYLPSNPHEAQLTLEFTDPENNPYFGGE